MSAKKGEHMAKNKKDFYSEEEIERRKFVPRNLA